LHHWPSSPDVAPPLIILIFCQTRRLVTTFSGRSHADGLRRQRDCTEKVIFGQLLLQGDVGGQLEAAFF